MNLSRCTKCGEVKSTDGFCKVSSRKSGLDPWCLACHRERNRARYKATRKKPPRTRRSPVFVKLTPEQWVIRKAETAERTKRSQEKHQWRMVNDPEYAANVREQRRLYQAKLREPERLKRAAEKAAKNAADLQRDIGNIKINGVRLKKTHHKVCPILRFSPDLRREELRHLQQARNFRRRSGFQGVRVDLTEAQWSAIKVAYRQRCAYCHQRKPLTKDHVVPVIEGGDHTAANIVPACKSCNSRKGVLPPRAVYQPHLIA